MDASFPFEHAVCYYNMHFPFPLVIAKLIGHYFDNIGNAQGTGLVTKIGPIY
jgi:hypothetical protein